MNDSTNLKEIFEAIEEINLLNDARKKKKVEQININNQSLTFKEDSINKKEKIPQSTEEIIKQAEKQLTLLRKK